MSSRVEHKIRPCPRPILKSLPEYSPLPFSKYPLDSPHVHFPPTPTLTSTSFTHSSIAYDRAPITVSENECALPERGGRCYDIQPRHKRSSRHTHNRNRSRGDTVGGSDNTQGPDPKGSYFHPRAFEVCEPEGVERHPRYDSYFTLPDLTSSSDSSSSSSSSSDSDSDSSCGSFTSSPPSIPRVVVDSTLGDASSTYPPNSSLFMQNGTQSRLSHSSQQQQQQQQEYIVHYPRPSSKMESTESKKTVSGRRMTSAGRSSSNSASKLNAAVRLAKYGGGFSDQTMLLEGCLGGF
ncbi:hypothetical protein P691DRAFT_798676 [Macrolepiota fuliginosa MF-IS2]|uniref:Uncharacterized protein n=1 Tax=Macrolepiota fuliginosa MF-IS2 TaxID=1400762 RepID=A0A9P6C6A3_9AGAR|nr:hypothetical protein P691DRAFT_798676 [Macrolepiota fuliginosa MF-IS2]